MSRERRCGACNGTGYELVMGEEICPGCAGSGRDNQSDLWSEPCRTCNGRKKVSYCRRDPNKSCRACNGRGTVRY